MIIWNFLVDVMGLYLMVLKDLEIVKRKRATSTNLNVLSNSPLPATILLSQLADEHGIKFMEINGNSGLYIEKVRDDRVL